LETQKNKKMRITPAASGFWDISFERGNWGKANHLLIGSRRKTSTNSSTEQLDGKMRKHGTRSYRRNARENGARERFNIKKENGLTPWEFTY